MQQLWKIYHYEIPTFIQEFANTKPMIRLKNIGMNCGCEYTQFPNFQKCQPYSRYDHSIGVALIIWHFTHDRIQAIAGLLHDIATPVFAHTIDFLNGDYETQESTEVDTEKMIRSCADLLALLQKYHIDILDVINYHIYPIADNDSPKLSADRLEYTLGNMLNYGFCSINDVQEYYNDLIVSYNEDGIEELTFQTLDKAIAFSQMAIKTSRIYIADEDRFSMQALADIIRFAIDQKILTRDDLYQDEPYVIYCLCSHQSTQEMWSTFTHYSHIQKSYQKPHSGYWLQINAKKRYIDVLVQNLGRISQLSSQIHTAILDIVQSDFHYYVSATSTKIV